MIKITFALSKNINLVQEENLSSKLLLSQLRYLSCKNFWRLLKKADKFLILISISNFIKGSKFNCQSFASSGGLHKILLILIYGLTDHHDLDADLLRQKLSSAGERKPLDSFSSKTHSGLVTPVHASLSMSEDELSNVCLNIISEEVSYK